MNSRSLKVLIIEDYTLIADSLRDNIADSQLCSEIHIADTALKARSVIRDIQPQVVLLDLNLPDENGMILLKELRHNSNIFGIIVMTNDSSDKLRHYCKCLGATYFVDKATELENITSYIKVLVNQGLPNQLIIDTSNSTTSNTLRPVNFANL